MLAYGCIVLNLAQKHGGSGWLEYDQAFRQQSSADPSIRWNSLNPSLMAATVLAAPSTTPGSFCPHCQEVDHSPPDCALLSVDPFLEMPGTQSVPSSSQTSPPNRPSPLGPTSEICRRFNRGHCPDDTHCRYQHVCSVPDCARSGHRAHNCLARKDRRRPYK